MLNLYDLTSVTCDRSPIHDLACLIVFNDVHCPGPNRFTSHIMPQQGDHEAAPWFHISLCNDTSETKQSHSRATRVVWVTKVAVWLLIQRNS